MFVLKAGLRQAVDLLLFEISSAGDDFFQAELVKIIKGSLETATPLRSDHLKEAEKAIKKWGKSPTSLE
jgi:hypothetical protein